MAKETNGKSGAWISVPVMGLIVLLAAKMFLSGQSLGEMSHAVQTTQESLRLVSTRQESDRKTISSMQQKQSFLEGKVLTELENISDRLDKGDLKDEEILRQLDDLVRVD